MISEIFLFILFIFIGFLVVVCSSVLIHVFRQGPSAVADLSRRGVGMKTWANGTIPDQSDGTSIDVIEGIDIIAKGNKLLRARQTRGIASEY